MASHCSPDAAFYYDIAARYTTPIIHSQDLHLPAAGDRIVSISIARDGMACRRTSRQLFYCIYQSRFCDSRFNLPAGSIFPPARV